LLGLLLVLVLALAVGSPSAPDGSTASPSPVVVTATSADASTTGPAGRTRVGPRLRAVDVPPRGRCSALHAPTLRVLQFNIHFGISRDGGIDLRRLATEIRAARPDLVSLNEVDDGTLRSLRTDEAGYLAGATGLHAIYGPNLPWQDGLFGNAILTHYPVVDSRNLRLPVAAGLEARGLLTTTVRVRGRIVSFSSLHLTDGPEGRQSRIQQAQAVADLLQHDARPTIVAGDLNAQPGSRPVRILRQQLLDAQEEGGTGRGETIPETAPLSRFDYVLYDTAFAVVPGSTRVLPSASSDHRAVLTELALLPTRCVT
jgi:endonuclease/exonuclease/phosphatase family metal-dependent hydrolase